MRIIALIQARMGSTRLPGKMLLPLAGRPVIEWVIHRTRQAAMLDQVVLATSVNPENDILARQAEHLGADCFRGSESDVLERFYQAATHFEASHVVRICADNPLIWGRAIDELIHFYLRTGCDYAYNHIPRNNSWPDGLGAEMLSYPLLERIAREATAPAHREHCFSYIWDNPGLFSIATFNPADPRLAHPEYKLDLDTAKDYAALQQLPLALDIHPAELFERMHNETRQSTLYPSSTP